MLGDDLSQEGGQRRKIITRLHALSYAAGILDLGGGPTGRAARNSDDKKRK